MRNLFLIIVVESYLAQTEQLIGLDGVLYLKAEVLHILAVVEAEWKLLSGLTVCTWQHVLWLVVEARHTKYGPRVFSVLLAVENPALWVALWVLACIVGRDE